MEIKNQIIKPAVSVVAMGETSNHMAAFVAGESPNLTEETSNHWAIVPFAGAKIEDYADIKSCHQCRRTKHVYGSCVTGTCSTMLCPRCLKLRYGEIVEAVVANNNWRCPICRGNCNCSYCRKKDGKLPTGKLIRIAKEAGCNSIAEYLEKYGDSGIRVAKTVGGERKKEVRKMVKAARDKKKQLKKKIVYVLARGETENNGIPLSVYQKLAILKKLDAETEQRLRGSTPLSKGVVEPKKTAWLTIDPESAADTIDPDPDHESG